MIYLLLVFLIAYIFAYPLSLFLPAIILVMIHFHSRAYFWGAPWGIGLLLLLVPLNLKYVTPRLSESLSKRSSLVSFAVYSVLAIVGLVGLGMCSFLFGGP